MPDTLPYRVLLYYQYVTIDDPAAFAEAHKSFCAELGLLGRILIAHEGINGTVSGPVEQTDRYMEEMSADPRFSSMPFKIDEADGHAFRKLIVKPRQEIVKLALEFDVDPRVRTGKRLQPAEFHAALQRDDVIIIDARNDYECQMGHFRGAIRPPVNSFHELPAWARENLAQHKGKTVLTYCTGGIRCEKFSAFLLQEGFEDVQQLEGGIVSYGKDPDVQGRLFDGSCYVFDKRGTVQVNRTSEATVIARCWHCGEANERIVNCANLDCDTQFVCCVECEFQQRRSCSVNCTHAPNHEFDPATAGTEKSFYR